MYQATYYVDKVTGTFSDVLLTYGVASLLDRIVDANIGATTVRVRDVGSVYVVALDEAIKEGYENIDWFCDLPFIMTDKKSPPEGWPGLVVDYTEEKKKRADYFQARSQLSPAARRPSATVDEYPELATVQALAPRFDWEILAQINQTGALTAYSQVLSAWGKCHACFTDLLRLFLALFATTPNDVDSTESKWNALGQEYGISLKTVTPVQTTNPAMAKGINRPKADGAHRLGNPDAFWLLEFLKFWGLRRAAIPRIIQSAQGKGGRGPRDRKTFVLLPVNITLDTHDKIYHHFNKLMRSSTAVKIDILAALRYTDTFLEQWLAGQLADVEWGEGTGRLRDGDEYRFLQRYGKCSNGP